MAERTVHTPPESRGTAPSRGRLTGRKVLVVGAGQTDIGEEDAPIGNGRAIALLCAREGARVAIADRNRDSAEATRRLVGDRKAAIVIEADVGKERDIERMVGEAALGLGGLDGVVLNVGVGVGDPWLSGITKDNWDSTFAINVTSHMLT